jgi:dolichol-phosphate mannosyltransferase
VTVVVPTLREVENIPHLVERLGRVRADAGLDLDVIVVDDDSRDGLVEVVESLSLAWVRVLVRTARPGLSEAVLDGLRQAEHDVLVVMDADLSHPPEKIPEMIDALEGGADMVVGSRFVSGGSTDDAWGVLRWLNSRVATLLAMPLSVLKDPMSGFFALRRTTFASGRDFNPVGYKIGLELLVKCDCQRVIEVPIHFTNRRLGKSKLTFLQQLKYLRHIGRLYLYRFGARNRFAQFLTIGLSGGLVNLVLLSVLLRLHAPTRLAIGAAIVVSMLSNFFLNRRLAFSYARTQAIPSQLLGFAAAFSGGAVVNFFTTVAAWPAFRHKQVAAMLGIGAGFALNFVACRFALFRQRHVKQFQSNP